LFSTEHSKGKILALSQELSLQGSSLAVLAKSGISSNSLNQLQYIPQAINNTEPAAL